MREFLFSSNGCSSWESLPRWGGGRGWGCRQCVGLCLSPWIQSVTEYVIFFSIVKTYVFLQNYGKVIKKTEVNFPITAMNKMLISFVQAEQKVNTLNDKFEWKKTRIPKSILMWATSMNANNLRVSWKKYFSCLFSCGKMMLENINHRTVCKYHLAASKVTLISLLSTHYCKRNMVWTD